VTALFDGDELPLPSPVGGGWTAPFGTEWLVPAKPVHIAQGYGPFVDYAVAQGEDPWALKAPWPFVHFIRDHAPDLDADDELRHAAGVFLGNSVAELNPAARWRVHAARGATLDFEDAAMRVERTITALLTADELRLMKFERVVARWWTAAGTDE
jgi:hypothetical protein